MMYDITKQTAPKGPRLGKGLEAFNLLISQTSSDMHNPLLPFLSPTIATISPTEGTSTQSCSSSVAS